MKIPYGKQEITNADVEAVIKTLKSDFLTQGPLIDQFEQVFADYVGAKYAIAVTNGTAALHLSTLALGVDSNSKVICTSNTFVASSNCVLYAGGQVEFCDIDGSSFLMDLDALEKKLDESAAGTYQGVIPVDFAGYPINAERLKSIAEKHNLWIIEDACHAPGATFVDSKGKTQKVGNGEFTDLTVFSFHPVKHIATGEGGMITTNSKELYDKLAILRTHGITKKPELLSDNHGGWYYEMIDLGYNYRLTDIQCALGISQLSRAEENIKRRRSIANIYCEKLKDLPIELPEVVEGMDHAYHLFVIQTDERKELYDFLHSKGILAQIHYIPVHMQPYYKTNNRVVQGKLPVCENYYDRCLSLPMYPSITDEELNYVITTLRSFFRK